MSFLQKMQQRYTTKMYDASKKLTSEQVERLKEILRLSPSSINSQPWKFTFVSDYETKKQLAAVSHGNSDRIVNCDTVIVFSRYDDIDLFVRQIEGELAPGMVNYFKNNLQPQGDDVVKSWFNRQVYIALGVLLSACANMGIDSTPMEGIIPAEYDKVLNDEGFSTVVAACIGHRDSEDSNQVDKNPKRRRELGKVIRSI